MQDFIRAIVTYLNRVATYDPLAVAVQLLMIGVVVWWVKRFLTGTRGAGMLKGAVLLLAVVYVVVRLLPKSDEWRRVEFLYGNFLIFMGIAAVVAFQPELRRALVQIGQATIFRGGGGKLLAMVGELVNSATYLSRNRIGAIVAIERNVGLGTQMETGTAIDAAVSASLLNTIFYPGSILHDMGVVIRGDRVAAAGCQFPLAEGYDLDQSLGSRHRAALGLAQETDAVVLIVSEETGRVSLAYDGRLSLNLELDHLREMLYSLLSERSLLGRFKKNGQEKGI
ncbi:MAG: diadenylate cyclase [Planctomycetes bacterium]|nr:diadenylate cyclase [Planctomycetota bacterium]